MGSGDFFEQRLDDLVRRVQECQNEMGKPSCIECDLCIGCEKRQEYVKAVYDSMSKGETGGFDF